MWVLANWFSSGLLTVPQILTSGDFVTLESEMFLDAGICGVSCVYVCVVEMCI